MRPCFLALLLITAPALGQPPAETCGLGDSLAGGDTLPVDVSLTVATDDFTMAGAGCNEQGLDHVTCLTPTSSCSVDAQCSDGALLQSAELLGLQVGVNVFDGGCATSPASCIASNSGTGIGSLTNVALTAGTTYCFVCETGFAVDLRLEILVASGDCGALPVELQSFQIE